MTEIMPILQNFVYCLTGTHFGVLFVFLYVTAAFPALGIKLSDFESTFLVLASWRR